MFDKITEDGHSNHFVAKHQDGCLARQQGGALTKKCDIYQNREVPVPAKEEKKHSEPGLQVGTNWIKKIG